MGVSQHNLSSSILDQCDPDTIVFLDTSVYASNIPKDNPALRIIPPNFEKYYSTNYIPGAITLIKPATILHSTLPSGVYTFIMYICPNKKTETVLKYLQVTKERLEISELVCELKLCDDEDKLAILTDLMFQLDIAQTLVASGCIDQGIELYNQIVKQISRMKSNKDCPTC